MHALFRSMRNWCFVAAVCAMAVPGSAVCSAHEVVYLANMTGPNEAPPNNSPGVGTALITFDLDLVTMRVEASFSGLLGNVTNAHIHAATPNPGIGTAGVATTLPTFPGFPAGQTSGSYDRTFDLTQASSYGAGFITANGGTVSGALNALLAAAETGRAYFNIHSTQFTGGEIRGFLVAVPEPSSFMLTAVALAAFTGRYRRRIRSIER